MMRILLVRLDGYVDTADAWARVLRDEGHEVVLDGPGDDRPEIDRVASVAEQEDAAVVVVPGAEHDWAHDLRKRLNEADVALAPPECEVAGLLEWVAVRDEDGHTDDGD